MKNGNGAEITETKRRGEAAGAGDLPSNMPMGRSVPKRLTREQSRHQTRERLLTAAAEIFLQKGFVATTLDEIAEAAGFSRGAVYANFAGKDDLFLTVFRRYHEQAAPVWAEVLAPDLPIAERQVGIMRLLASNIEELKEQARSGCYTWTLLELEFVLTAFRSPETRTKLAQHYRDLRHDSEQLTASAERAWLSLALNLGVSILVCVDPEATPAGVWDLAAPILFGNRSGPSEMG